MNNDLIRRGDVLDILEKIFDEYNMTWDKQGGFAQAVPDAIREIPTAFNLESAIVELEKNSQDIALIYPTDQGYEYAYGVGIDIDNATTILKSTEKAALVEMEEEVERE